MSVPETLDDLPRRLARWAVNRSLAPASVTGISLALAVCAAGWFSAGTRPDNVNGALALCASYLAAMRGQAAGLPGPWCRGAVRRRRRGHDGGMRAAPCPSTSSMPGWLWADMRSTGAIPGSLPSR